MVTMAAQPLEPLITRLDGALRAVQPAMSATAHKSRNTLQARVGVFREKVLSTGLGPANAGLSGRLLRDAALVKTAPMVVYGFGTCASLATPTQHAKFTGSLYHVHSVLEAALDKSSSPAVRAFWDANAEKLRRVPALEADLKSAGAWPPPDPSLETLCFMRVVEDAHRSDETMEDEPVAGSRLLGHVFWRHMADFAGAGALAQASRRALGLELNALRRYRFEASPSIDTLLASFNAAAELAPPHHHDAIVREAQRSLAAHANVCAEPGAVGLGFGAATGVKRLVLGARKPSTETAVAPSGTGERAEAMDQEAPAASFSNASNAKAAIQSTTDTTAGIASPPTAIGAHRDAQERLAALKGVNADAIVEGGLTVKDMAMQLNAAFGDAEASPLLWVVNGLAESARAREAASVNAEKAEREHANLLGAASLRNRENLAETIASLKRDQLRAEGPHSSMVIADTKADSRGLDGGSVVDLTARMTAELSDFDARLDGARQEIAGFVQAEAAAAEQIAHHRKRLSEEVGHLKVLSDRALQKELGKVGQMRARAAEEGAGSVTGAMRARVVRRVRGVN